jgi:hypothetical protein
MATRNTSLPKMPLKDRLGFRLAMLFATTFGAVFLLGAIYSVFSSVMEKRQADEQILVQPVAVVIDPKIQTELAKAIAFDVMPTEVAVQDPFIDRTGISASGISLAASPAVQRGTARIAPAPSGGSSVSSLRGPSIQIVPGAGVQPQVQIDAKARYQNWIARQSAGEFVGPESEALGISDLVPVGFVSGGDGNPEVMLYSAALCKTFSFPAGTRFADGWLSSISDAEVVFTVDQMVRRKSFARPEPCPAPDTKSVGAVAFNGIEQAGAGE